jgi:hypothetical protein
MLTSGLVSTVGDTVSSGASSYIYDSSLVGDSRFLYLEVKTLIFSSGDKL